jgi:predicted dinucleotide-utilizing enzyme
LRSSHQAVEEAKIQSVKNLIKIVMFAFGTLNALASAQLANELRLLRHGMTAGVFAVSGSMGSVDGLAMELGNEDVQDGIKHRFWRAFKKIREADKDASLAQADGAIDVGEAVEADLKFRQRSAWTQIAIGLLKNLVKGGRHL